MNKQKQKILFLLRFCMIVLLIVSVPWYGSLSLHQTPLLGMPAWVTRALLCYGLIVIINLLVWVLLARWSRETNHP